MTSRRVRKLCPSCHDRIYPYNALRCPTCNYPLRRVRGLGAWAPVLIVVCMMLCVFYAWLIW